MTAYTAEVTYVGIVDATADDREFRGTITDGEICYQWRTVDYGLKRDGSLPERTFLYSEDGKTRVKWGSSRKARREMGAAMQKAIAANALMRNAIFYDTGEVDLCELFIEPDKVTYRDKWKTKVYQRNEDGSVVIPKDAKVNANA